MWDDEDNNPYASSFDHHNSASGVTQTPFGLGFQPPDASPSSVPSPGPDSTEFISKPPEYTNVYYDNEFSYQHQISPKKGGYDSRIEQILYENPSLPILITHAGKNLESGGSYIAYTIRTADLEVRRRYSEFASLRHTLVNLHPTLVIPPIPEKHSMADYAAKPTKAKEDTGIIEYRKRMLAVFLNRCRRMSEIRDDGLWWRFLDPNASWSEVLHSYPAASIPKQILKAPPLDTANPTQAHSYLPVPSSSAKLKPAMVTAPKIASLTHSAPSVPVPASQTTPGPEVFGIFPPDSRKLSKDELDPYFVNLETCSKELESLLQHPMEKCNRKLLYDLSKWSEDMAELGARYNAFSLSEQSRTLIAAIEKIGQAVDSTYIATSELSSSLGTGFAEPMRESAQFASVVRSVLRYRVLKRIQEDMTRSELQTKKNFLDSLEQSEMEARRIEQYLNEATASASYPRRPSSSGLQQASQRQEKRDGDTASIDSDFPHTHGESNSPPSAAQGISPSRKSPSKNFVANKIFGRINYALHGIVDADPERTRRDQIGKTKEILIQLEQALEVSQKDTEDASAGALKDLRRFQSEKEEDLKRYMISFAKSHIAWARENRESWREARAEVDNIEARVET